MHATDLGGRVVLITGAGRPRGIGDASARAFAARGAHVVVCDLPARRADLELPGVLETADGLGHLEALAESLRQAGGRARALALDVTDGERVREVVQQIKQDFGRVDVVVNNAGTGVGARPFLELDDAAWDLSWAVNVRGMVDICRAAIPVMREQGGGAIVNVASLLGLGAVAGYAGYTTTKFAVVGLTKAVAAEFGGDGIRCNAVCPGMIETLMGESEARLVAQQHAVSVADAKRLMSEPAALKRLGQPDDVAEVIAFLASDAARYLTGLAIPVSGGMPIGL